MIRNATLGSNIASPQSQKASSRLQSGRRLLRLNLTSTWTFPRKQPTTPHGPPLLTIDDTPVKAEVILIKDESEEQAEKSIVAEETQQVETHHPSNNTEMPSKYPATLSTIEALELAEKCVDKCAGRHTQELEEKLKAFICESLASAFSCTLLDWLTF
jgi:hypothetical protein